MDEKEVKKRLAKLTRQECIVLYWRCHGFKCEQIAETLVISVKTVEFHLDNIYKKLQVKHLKDRERYLELKVAFCPLHVEGIENPETDFQKRPKPPPEPDIPPEDVKPIPKEALKIIRREDEEGLIPNVGGPVAKRPSRDIIIIPPPTEDDDDDEEKEKPRRANLWYALGGVVIGLLLATGAFRFFAPTEVKSTESTQPTSTAVVVVVTATPQPTPEVTATLIPTAVPPVAVPPTPTKVPTAQPTNTPAPTPRPSPTTEANTASGTILKAGQSWFQNGIRMTVSEPIFRTEGRISLCNSSEIVASYELGFAFIATIENETGTDIVASWSNDDWYLIDSKGRKFGVAHGKETFNYACLGFGGSNLLPSEKRQVFAGVKVALSQLNDIPWVRLVVPRLARIQNAIWEFEIPH